MARIPYLDLADAPPEFAEALKSRPPLNVYRMVAHGGATATGFLALGSAILSKSTLDPKLRELVILRVGALSDAKYEVFQHRRVAARAGVPASKIEAVLANPSAEPVSAVFRQDRASQREKAGGGGAAVRDHAVDVQRRARFQGLGEFGRRVGEIEVGYACHGSGSPVSRARAAHAG